MSFASFLWGLQWARRGGHAAPRRVREAPLGQFSQGEHIRVHHWIPSAFNVFESLDNKKGLPSSREAPKPPGLAQPGAHVQLRGGGGRGASPRGALVWGPRPKRPRACPSRQGPGLLGDPQPGAPARRASSPFLSLGPRERTCADPQIDPQIGRAPGRRHLDTSRQKRVSTATRLKGKAR